MVGSGCSCGRPRGGRHLSQETGRNDTPVTSPQGSRKGSGEWGDDDVISAVRATHALGVCGSSYILLGL